MTPPKPSPTSASASAPRQRTRWTVAPPAVPSDFSAEDVRVASVSHVVNGTAECFMDRQVSPFISFCWIAAGRVRIHDGEDLDLDLRAGDFCVLFPNKFLTVDLLGVRNDVHVLSLDGPCAVDYGLSLGFRDQMRTRDTCPVHGLQSIALLLAPRPDDDTRQALFSDVQRLLASVMARIRADAPDKLLHDARVLVQQNLGDKDFDTSALCKALGISHTTLSNAFRQAGLPTPVAYLVRQRMRRARYLLRNGSAPVGLVGALCGYPDSAYFGAAFKRATGFTPRQYRLFPQSLIARTDP